MAMWLDAPRNPKAPLAGIRVLELARVLAGPFCGQILADLGADVIKVESPDGDGTRQWGPPWIEHEGERTAAYYHACNRGKRSIVADFRDAEQLALVHALADGADVVIENFLPGKLARFGLDHARLSERNDAIVTCSISGFGQDGPRRDEPGYDFVIQAMSGMMSLTGEPDGAPMKHGLSISDLACGLWAANAIQAALLMRERPGARQGRGQHIDMSLLDSSVALLANQAMSWFASEQLPPRMGNAHAQVSAYGVFPTKDGPVVLAPANDGLFRRLLTVLKREDLLADPRYASNAGRLAHRTEIDAVISGATRELTRADLLSACAEAGIPAGPINDLAEVFADPQVVSRGGMMKLGGVATLPSPFRFSDAELALDRASPSLGKDMPDR